MKWWHVYVALPVLAAIEFYVLAWVYYLRNRDHL